MRKLLCILLPLGLVILVFVLFVKSNSSSSLSKISPTPIKTPVITVNPNDPPKEMTLEGEYTCLPHVNTTGPQTMECALGMKLQDGSYVALDMGSLPNTSQSLQTGSKIRVFGLYVPIEQISSNAWKKYQIKGILQVKDVTIP